MTTDQQLARLERQNAKIEMPVVLAVVLAVVLLVAASQDQDKPTVLEEVRAKRFVIVDAAGRERIATNCDNEVSQFFLRAPGGELT